MNKYQNLAHQAELRFYRVNLKYAKGSLAEANKLRDPALQRSAMAQLNKARSYLRSAMRDAEIDLYGAPRKQGKRAAALPRIIVKHIPGSLHMARVGA